jgi:hypothetical protein
MSLAVRDTCGCRACRDQLRKVDRTVQQSPIGEALLFLDPDQLFVVVSWFWGKVPEQQIAAELSELRNVRYTRDRVHRIRLTAEARLERKLRRWMVAA